MKNRSLPMKPFFHILAVLSLTALGAHARTWTSSDGKNTFEGELVEYKAETGEVTVDRGGKRITFKQQILSGSDIDFLKNAKAAPAPAPAPSAPAPTEAPAPASAPPSAPIPVSKAATPAANIPDYTFNPAPLASGRPWLIKNFGPVGIGIMLENTLFGVSKGEAYQMEIRTYDGHDFLIIECGNFAPAIPKEGEAEPTPVPPDFHCGYHIYMRKK